MIAFRWWSLPEYLWKTYSHLLRESPGGMGCGSGPPLDQPMMTVRAIALQ